MEDIATIIGVKTAIFDPSRQYRYTLTRAWGTDLSNYANFICLNPSTADETNDDPTMRRCINYAKDWNYDAMVVTNIFAIRSTDPRILKTHPEPIGPENNGFIERVAMNAKLIVCAWGNHGSLHARSSAVRLLLRGAPLYCFRISKTGEPVHPLYQPRNTELIAIR